MRHLRYLSALSACVALLSVGPAAAAPAGRGVLSGAEYQQLHLAQKRIRSLASANARSLTRADSVCARMHAVSPLIGAVRSGCRALVRLGGDDGRLNARATHCGINPPSEAAIFTCMVPAVRTYYNDAEAFYRAESRVNRIARARRFSSACIAVIGDSPANIAAEGRLAGDLRSAVAALRRQDPNALQTLTSNVERDVKAIRPGPTSLALCPHR